jgi:oligopeptide transport system substrate-binding protein
MVDEPDVPGDGPIEAELTPLLRDTTMHFPSPRPADYLSGVRIRANGRMSSMRSSRGLAAVAAVVVAGLIAACGDSGGESTGGSGKAGGTFRLGISEPVSIDPYNSQESEGQLVTKALFEGLVKLDGELALQPAVAEKWSRSDECTEWTFNIRKGTKFSNGEDVTAQSFIDGINRSVGQAAASDVATFAADIDGYDAVHGEVDDDGKVVKPATTDKLSGLTAPDANTLKVKLANPDCEFDKKTLQPIFMPVPTVAGAFDNQTYNDLPIGNGPFNMAGPWQHDRSITLVRSETYYGTKAFLDKVELTIEDIADEYNNFKAGGRDFARIPDDLAPEAKSTYERDGKFITQVTNGFDFLMVNNVNPPLNNPDARKAISSAINRPELINAVFTGLPVVAADSIVPPLFSEAYKKGVCEACTFNVTKAKEYAQKGGLTAGTKVPIAYNVDGGHKTVVEAIAGQLEKNLGIKVEIVEVAKFGDLLGKLEESSASGLFRASWGADYPSPVSFVAPLLTSASGGNLGKYESAKYDDLVQKAAGAKDDKSRGDLTQQAEKVALDEMGLIPLWYRTQFRVVDNSKWKNITLDFFENPTLATISLK